MEKEKSKDLQMEKIFNFVLKERKLPPNIKFIVASEKKNYYYFIYKDTFTDAFNLNFFPLTNDGKMNYSCLKNKSGKVLRRFCELENVLDELIVIILGGFDKAEKQNLIRKILKKLNLSEKINILKSEDIISNKISEYLFHLKDFRNQIAHEWLLKDLKYKSKKIVDDGALKFKKREIEFGYIANDFNCVWNEIMKIYRTRQKPVLDWLNELMAESKNKKTSSKKTIL